LRFLVALLVLVPSLLFAEEATSSCFSKLDVAGLHQNVECSSVLQGMKLTYNVPKVCAAGVSCGVIMDVHGLFMDADMEDAGTNMRNISEVHNYILIQPTAPGDNWNLPLTCQGKDSCPGDGAVVALLQQALAVPGWNISRAHTHFMGFSEGGMMAARMVCHYPGVFASLVSMEGAGCLPAPFECLNSTTQQPPLLIQMGWNDVAMKPPVGTGHTMSDPPMQYVSHIWGLDSGEIIGGDNSSWQHTRYLGRTGVALEFLNFSYVADTPLKGHCFPGSTKSVLYGCPGAKERREGQTAGYKIGEVAMKFFLANPAT